MTTQQDERAELIELLASAGTINDGWGTVAAVPKELLIKAAALLQADAAPIDMVLYCPKCHTQHIDAPEPGKLISGGPSAGRVRQGWTNPPHKSHLCHGCGHIWRPSDTPTNGVIATASGKDADCAPVMAADAEVGGEAVAIDEWCSEVLDAIGQAIYAAPAGLRMKLTPAVERLHAKYCYTCPQQAAQVPPEIQAVIEAARQWWCDRAPQNWDDAELAKAVIRLDGDWPGCPGCDHECDEPCMPATMQEQLHAVDCHVAQLVHEGKLHPGDDYTPPTGWEPKPYPKKAAHRIGKDQG